MCATLCAQITATRDPSRGSRSSLKRTVKIHLSRSICQDFTSKQNNDYFFGLDISGAISLIGPLLQTSYWRCPLSASPLEQGHSPAAGTRRRLFHPDSPPAEDANRHGVVVRGGPDRPQGPWHSAPAHPRICSPSPDGRADRPSYAHIRWPRAAVSAPPGRRLTSARPRSIDRPPYRPIPRVPPPIWLPQLRLHPFLNESSLNFFTIIRKEDIVLLY